jgi:hypothetical protein
MLCLYLSLTAILAGVAGFGKNVVPLFRLWTCGGFLSIRPQPVRRFGENRSFAHNKSSVGSSLLIGVLLFICFVLSVLVID